MADPLPGDCLRILDANANRAAEGLRVVEEYFRFVRQDSTGSELCKRMRHELAEALSVIDWQRRLQARDVPADVGRVLETESETIRRTAEGVARASIHRLQQALRVLEEYGKLHSAALGRQCEQLRYRSYQLEQRLADQANGGAAPAKVTLTAADQLYLLVDGGRSPEDLQSRLEPLLQVGLDLVQLRDKQLDDRQLLERARLARTLTRQFGSRLIINDRPDLAVLSEADGVHVGQEELLVADARRLLAPDQLVGVSTHSLEQARQAVAEGADYIGCGPTFPSTTKAFERFTGPTLLAQIAREVALPAFAIGGIRFENLHQVLATGFRRIAVSGAIWNATDPVAELHRMRAALRSQDALSAAHQVPAGPPG